MKETFLNIWEFSKNRHSSMIKSLVFSFLRSIFGLCELLAIIVTIDVLTGGQEVKAAVIKIAVLTLICIIGNFITSYIEQISTMETGFFMVGDKRVDTAGLLRKVPLGFFNQSSAGRITASLTTTLSGVETASAMVMIGIIAGLFSSLALFLFMIFYNFKTGIIAGAGMLVYLAVVSWQMKVSRKSAPALQEAQSELAESALTFLQGIKVTKAFSFKNGDQRLKDAIKGSCKENIKLTSVSMPSQFAAHLTIAVFESLILIYTLYMYFVTAEIPVIKVIVLMIFSFMVYVSLNQAGSMLSMIGLLDSAMNEFKQIEKTQQMQVIEPVAEAENNNIVFQNVSFSYGENEVLHNVSTEIKQDSLTAVIGPSGSGKTTMCQLIPRFRDVTSGKITIGGADVRNIPYDQLMKKISMVFQNVYLFEDTILNNIRFGKPDATMEEVKKAAKAARCDEFIMGLKDGYNTMVEEGGNSLSGGEKQRISIARAILKDSPVIILDEATSALDAENEKEILSAIEELTKNKTVIMIAHRIKTVEKADHIIALDKGTIVQEGKHKELIKEDGLYKDFVKARESASSWKLEI